jgi:hypothetical protein
VIVAPYFVDFSSPTIRAPLKSSTPLSFANTAESVRPASRRRPAPLLAGALLTLSAASN